MCLYGVSDIIGVIVTCNILFYIKAMMLQIITQNNEVM